MNFRLKKFTVLLLFFLGLGWSRRWKPEITVRKQCIDTSSLPAKYKCVVNTDFSHSRCSGWSYLFVSVVMETMWVSVVMETMYVSVVMETMSFSSEEPLKLFKWHNYKILAFQHKEKIGEVNITI